MTQISTIVYCVWSLSIIISLNKSNEVDMTIMNNVNTFKLIENRFFQSTLVFSYINLNHLCTVFYRGISVGHSWRSNALEIISSKTIVGGMLCQNDKMCWIGCNEQISASFMHRIKFLSNCYFTNGSWGNRIPTISASIFDSLSISTIGLNFCLDDFVKTFGINSSHTIDCHFFIWSEIENKLIT